MASFFLGSISSRLLWNWIRTQLLVRHKLNVKLFSPEGLSRIRSHEMKMLSRCFVERQLNGNKNLKQSARERLITRPTVSLDDNRCSMTRFWGSTVFTFPWSVFRGTKIIFWKASGSTEIRTRDGWVRNRNATSVLRCFTPRYLWELCPNLIVFHYELWNFSGGLVFTKRIKRWPGCLRLPVVSLHLAGHPPVRPHRRLGHSHLSRVGRAGKKNMQQPSFVVLNPILAERAKSQK